MSRYSLSITSTVNTSGAPSWDLKAGAGVRPILTELSIQIGAGTASSYGFGRASNTPTQTSPILLRAEDPDDPAATSGCAVAWSVAPTVPAAFLRRVHFVNNIVGIIWTFPRGLVLAAGAAFVLWNNAVTSNPVYINVTAEE